MHPILSVVSVFFLYLCAMNIFLPLLPEQSFHVIVGGDGGAGRFVSGCGQSWKDVKMKSLPLVWPSRRSLLVADRSERWASNR